MNQTPLLNGHVTNVNMLIEVLMQLVRIVDKENNLQVKLNL